MQAKARFDIARFARDMSISTQLILMVAGLVLLITLVLAGVLDAIVTQREEAAIGQQFSELAAQATDKLDRTLFERFREVELLANQPGFGSLDTLPQKRRLLEEMQKTYAYYAWLGLTDKDGKVLVSANGLLEGANVAQRPWFRRALEGVHLTDVHEAELLDKLLRTGTGKEPLRFIDVAFPYRDAQGRVAGVFGTHLSLAWATDIEQSVMQPLLARAGAETLILGKDMTVVIGPKSMVGTRLALPATAFSVPGPHAYRVAKFDDGKTYLVGYNRMRGYNASPGLDWTVLVRQDVTLAYAPVIQLRKQVMLVGGGIALLFAVLAWPLSRHIARPLGALAASARRVELSESSHIDDIHGSYREIGQLRTALQSLVGQLQANEASLQQTARRKDEFLATLAHEFRNPLAPIAAAADLLRIGRADGAQQRRLGEIITRQTHHMTGLIDGLMDVSRVTRGEVKLNRHDVDLRDVVAEAMEQTAPLIAAKRHRVDTRLALGPLMVMGDKKRLVQVLANLLHNAAKYTPDGGSIDVALSSQDGQALVSVRDNGIGMSAELMSHVFELFTQETRKVDLSAGGLGVGLALAKRLVDLHDGTLTVSSPGKDQGSEFVLALPMIVSAGAANDVSQDAQQQPLRAAAARVLIVDDNVDAANTLGMLVESLGYDVSVEYQGHAALERVRLEPPKICLLDIGMPVMDGYELASRLRALPEMHDAFIVAVTGYGQPSDRERALLRGFDDHIVKPVDVERLMARLSRAGADHPAAAGTQTCLD